MRPGRPAALFLAAIFGALIVSACAATSGEAVRPIPLVIESRARLVLALDACTKTYGYSPAVSADGAERGLAPGEREWRACAYEAVRRHARDNAEMKPLYERLIAEDEAMTAALEAGTMTRAERRARLDDLVAEIRAVEDARARSDLDIRQIQTQQLRQSFEGVKEFTR